MFLVEPTLISDLNDSDVNKILLSTKHTHSYGTNSITTNYRLRAWIDYDVDASSWTSETKYEYKFRININGNIDALDNGITPTSCFKFASDGNGGAKIIDYLCDEDSISQTSTSLNKGSISTMPNYLDSNNSSKKLTNEVITDVVIPSTITASIVSYPTQEELTDDDRTECAVFFTKNIDGVSTGTENYNETYQGWYTFCSGGTYQDITLNYILPMVSEYELILPGISDLKVFKKTALPEATYQVTSIGDYAFMENELTSVTIPNSVATIGEDAFRSNKLTSLMIPNSVTTIGEQTFAYNDLTSVTIPSSVTLIDESTFDNEVSVTIDPNNTKYNDGGIGSIIETATNKLIKGNTNGIILNTIVEIGDRAFSGYELTSIVIPNSVTTIGEYAFAWNDLTSLTLGNSVVTIGEYAFAWNDLTSVTIPNLVISIGSDAFFDNKLTSLMIPNSVTSIGEKAFAWNDLTSVTIPNSVTSIFAGSFDKQVSVTIDPNNTKYNDGGIGSIIETATNKLIKGNMDGIIPNTIVEIGDYAFYSYGLTSAIIPNSVITIGNNAFGYNNLTSVTIPNSVTTIEEQAFRKNNLTSVIINSGSNLTAETGIGENAFSGNQNLTIYNNSGKAFDWNNAISGTSASSFVTGTVGTVNITTGSPS